MEELVLEAFPVPASPTHPLAGAADVERAVAEADLVPSAIGCFHVATTLPGKTTSWPQDAFTACKSLRIFPVFFAADQREAEGASARDQHTAGTWASVPGIPDSRILPDSYAEFSLFLRFRARRCHFFWVFSN